MSGHTKGPWEAIRWTDNESDTYGWSFSAAGHSLPLCEVETDNPDECDANARLIAAAPELLEALKACLEKGSRWHPCDDVVVKAREAIVKATGEQP